MSHTISIELQDIAIRFNKEWLFKNVNLLFPPESKSVILGGNGSGKSTLLQIISGYLMPEKGKVLYKNSSETEIPQEHTHAYISFASPFLTLTEDFNLSELIKHTAIYKPFSDKLPSSAIIEMLELKHAANKPLKYFSSGMKQRAKLGMAILSDCPILLLDEPLTNLDANGIVWYKNMMKQHANAKTVVICSNAVKDEYAFCEKEINISDYKLF